MKTIGATLDLASLRCFAAAALQKNFRSAARTVALSPAAFSDRIRRLEDDVDAALFDRTTRRVALTAAGERLLGPARTCLAEAERCREAVRGGATPPFDLVIGTRFELGMSWLTPLCGPLESARPERRIHLHFGDTAELLRQLREDNVDCLVTSARIAAAGLSYARLHEEGYVFVASPRLLTELPLARREHCSAHTLLELSADLPLFRYFLDARPGGEQWSFASVRHLGTIGAVRARLLEGAGVAVLPHYFAREDVRRRRLVVVMPKVRLPRDWFRLVWRQRHPREHELQGLASELSSHPLR